MSPLIDTHAHLDDERFATDLPAVLERAQATGVVQIVTVATSASSTAASLALAQRHPFIFAAAGIHPNHAAQAEPADWDRVADTAVDPHVVGIGETGLDRHWNDTPFPMQEDYFARHLELGRRLDKPVIVHCREAETDVLRMLRADFDRDGPLRAVMHSFTGTKETAAACLAMGLHLSFAGMLTYKNAADLRNVAAELPANRLLVETDSPYLAPVPVRGKRNEPANVVHTAACLAATLGIEPEELRIITTRNARELFRLPSETC